MFKAFAQRLAARTAEESRPDIKGYSREVQELHKVHVTLTQLLRATTHNFGISLPLGPLYPYELQAIDKAREDLAELDDDIAAAMKTSAMPSRREAHAST